MARIIDLRRRQDGMAQALRAPIKPRCGRSQSSRSLALIPLLALLWPDWMDHEPHGAHS
jgi:hypothetical protein